MALDAEVAEFCPPLTSVLFTNDVDDAPGPGGILKEVVVDRCVVQDVLGIGRVSLMLMIGLAETVLETVKVAVRVVVSVSEDVVWPETSVVKLAVPFEVSDVEFALMLGHPVLPDAVVEEAPVSTVLVLDQMPPVED